MLAGGQSLVPLMNFRLAQPHNLIDLNGIEGLDQIKLDDQTLSLGAMVRQRDVERSPAIAERLPILREAIEQVAHPAIRNRGTVGGSLVHADPSAELPLLAIALDATFHLRSARASRSVAAKDFYQGYLLTDIAPDELLVAIDFHLAAGGFRLVLHRDRAPAWRFRHRRGGGAARLRARSENRLRARRAWRSRSGAAPHDRGGTGALGRAAWRRSFSPGGRYCGASGGSAGRHPRFFELPAPSHRRVGAPRLGDCGKSDQRARVMTEMISITFKVNGSEQAAAVEPRRSFAQRTIIAHSYGVKLVTLWLMIFFCLAAPLSAASLQKIVVAYVSPSDSMIIPGIARDSGILAKYGFDADVVLVTGSPRVVQSLIGGSFDYAIPEEHLSCAHVFKAQIRLSSRPSRITPLRDHGSSALGYSKRRAAQREESGRDPVRLRRRRFSATRPPTRRVKAGYRRSNHPDRRKRAHRHISSSG